MPILESPMKFPALLTGVALSLAAVAPAAQAAPSAIAQASASGTACPPGSYHVVTSPDGTSISVLFDAFTVDNANGPSALRRSCHILAPLNLPAGYSAGVYKVDYRGYARLAPRQSLSLAIDYGTVGKGNIRQFRRAIRGGPAGFDNDFTFSENLGAGLMWRMGCGSSAVLDITAALALVIPATATGEAMGNLDSIDGAPAALTYNLDLRKCDGGPPMPSMPGR